MRSPIRILISAGEASGDRLGAGLARAILRRRPEAELLGMGGRRMAEAGVRIVQSASEIAVMGLVEVLTHLPALYRAMGRLQDCIEREKPDLVVPVDFPDFNLRLAGRAHRAGVPVVYFVSPQLWAWRKGRVRRIRELVRRMLVLFPFETAFYERAGVPVTFVGHPAVEEILQSADGDELLRRAGLDPTREVIALLPGSRRGEVARILPRLLQTAAILRRRRQGLQFLIPSAGMLPERLLEEAVRQDGLEDVAVHGGDYPSILGACAAGAVTSGTATLEAALAGLPMVVVYRVSSVSFLLSQLIVQVDHVALPNLVAGRRIVPELIQWQCTPERIAEGLLEYLSVHKRTEEVRSDLAEVRRRLGCPGAFDRAAEAVLSEAGG